MVNAKSRKDKTESTNDSDVKVHTAFLFFLLLGVLCIGSFYLLQIGDDLCEFCSVSATMLLLLVMERLGGTKSGADI